MAKASEDLDTHPVQSQQSGRMNSNLALDHIFNVFHGFKRGDKPHTKHYRILTHEILQSCHQESIDLTTSIIFFALGTTVLSLILLIYVQKGLDDLGGLEDLSKFYFYGSLTWLCIVTIFRLMLYKWHNFLVINCVMMLLTVSITVIYVEMHMQ